MANWTVLAPVGGITIYESFELSFHPLRLQLDAKVGRRIMEYVWPDRKNRAAISDDPPTKDNAQKAPLEITVNSPKSGRSSVDSPRGVRSPSRSKTTDFGDKLHSPSLRKLGASRSFTDLRLTRDSNALSPPGFDNHAGFLSPPAFLKRTNSSDSVNFSSMLEGPSTPAPGASFGVDTAVPRGDTPDDAQVMKTRSSQKSFVLVRISRYVGNMLDNFVAKLIYAFPSIHLLLSVVKEGSFECHDAKIKTRELEYRNQTWSVRLFFPLHAS